MSKASGKLNTVLREDCFQLVPFSMNDRMLAETDPPRGADMPNGVRLIPVWRWLLEESAGAPGDGIKKCLLISV